MLSMCDSSMHTRPWGEETLPFTLESATQGTILVPIIENQLYVRIKVYQYNIYSLYTQVVVPLGDFPFNLSSLISLIGSVLNRDVMCVIPIWL